MLVCQKTHMYTYTALIPSSLMPQLTPFDTPTHMYTNKYYSSLPWSLGQLVFTNLLVPLWNLTHHSLDSDITLGSNSSQFFHTHYHYRGARFSYVTDQLTGENIFVLMLQFRYSIYIKSLRNCFRFLKKKWYLNMFLARIWPLGAGQSLLGGSQLLQAQSRTVEDKAAASKQLLLHGCQAAPLLNKSQHLQGGHNNSLHIQFQAETESAGDFIFNKNW